MPKAHRSRTRSKKGNLLTNFWGWFLGTHLITKSVIVFGIAVTLVLPSIYQANWNIPTITHAYGWLGRCGGNGADICTTQPWYYHGVIYSESVPGNQCAINGTLAGLRGAQINCCGTKAGNVYGTCNSGSSYCTTDTTYCQNIVPNFSFENPGDTNWCPALNNIAFPAEFWSFIYGPATNGGNYLAQSCAQRDGSNATDGQYGMSVTVKYQGSDPYPLNAQQVELFDNLYYLQTGTSYKIIFSAKESPTVNPDNTGGGVVDVAMTNTAEDAFIGQGRFAIGPNWQTYSTDVFTPNAPYLYNRLRFNFGEKSQHVWIDNVNIQVVSPYVGNYYTSYTDHTACGIQATQGGWPRGTTVYCVVP